MARSDEAAAGVTPGGARNKAAVSPATVFKSFLVTNKVPQPRTDAAPSPPRPDVPPQKIDKRIVCDLDWFRLRKYELKKPLVIEDPRLQRKLKDFMDKHSDWVQLDYEKAMLLAQAQGAQLSMNSKLSAPGMLAEHQADKELYYSCYIQGMKAYLKSTKGTKLGPKQLKRVDAELEQSESKRSDIKRVLMRFNKESQKGYRLDIKQALLSKTPAPQEDFMTMLDAKYNIRLPIWTEFKPLQKELLDKYCPLYDLKMNSTIEDIDSKYSLAEIAKGEKVEHEARMTKVRE